MVKINRRIGSLVGSTTLAITARAKELKAQGKDVVNFAGGEPDFNTPDPIKEAAVKAMNEGQTKYTPSVGTLQLREAICAKFKKDNRLDYDPAQVVVSCGAKHSLYNVIQVIADEGDEVLIPAPYWVSYPEMVKAAGARPKFLPTTPESHFKITAGQLAGSVSDKTRILILNSPSNPTGMLYSRRELESIAEVCVKNDIFVISDEIYEKLIYDNAEFTSIGALGKDIFERTITVNGMSKAYAMTGWRIGYAAGPKEIMGVVKKLQDHSTSCPSSISQAGALQALKSSPDSVHAMRDEFQKRRELMIEGFKPASDIVCHRPDGAFYLWCDISKLGESMEVAKKILDDVNVAFIPGEGFGAPGFARLSFSTSQERIQAGTRRIVEWVQKNR